MSIIDGLYWEREYRKCDEVKLERERKENLQKNFNKKMPCNDCIISDICKFSFDIEFPTYDSDVFDIEITCKKQQIK